jgi:hypothetical protein
LSGAPRPPGAAASPEPEIEMPHASPQPTDTAAPSRAQRLAHAFSLVAADLSNPWDESTDRFAPFHAPLADDVPLDAQGLRAALDVGARFHLDVQEPDLGQVADDRDDDEAAGYRLLDAVMRAALGDLKLVFARGDGAVRVRTWLLGRLPGQGLVGLRTESTET